MSSRISKIFAAITITAVVVTFVLIPAPAQAGGGGLFGGVIGVIVGTVFCVVTYGAGCVFAAADAAFIGVGLGVASALTSASFGIFASSLAISAVTSAAMQCDPVFGTCTKDKTETQEIRTSRNVRFEKITYASVPSPEEFIRDPSASGRTVIRWKGDAPQGVAESVEIIDKATGQKYPVVSGTAGIACTQGEYETIYNLPFEKEFIGEINYATCIQIAGGRRRREYRAVCSGCGGRTNLVKTEFSTPALPLPKVDIKADNQDTLVFRAGVPIRLTWESEYATSCEAQGSWNGAKETSGSQTVTPLTGNEVYTLVCRRGDKSDSDSVSSAPAAKEIRIFDVSDRVSGGSLGGLNISFFNATNPLNPGDTVTISWSVQNAKSCEVDNGIGQIPTSGSVDIVFLKTTTFTLTCVNDQDNSISAQRTVSVRRPPGFKEIKPE